MPRTASGKTRIERIIKRQSNGDRYVYERASVYDPKKKYYVNAGSTLLGKMKPGSDDRFDLLPTRPKAKSAPAIRTSHPNTVTMHTGMIDIVRYISEISGVEKELTAAIPANIGLRKKTQTLVWYGFATDGDTWPGIRSWCIKYAGQLPYEHTPISQDIYHDVFVELGRNEEIRQSIFTSRAKDLGDGSLVALDSTTIESFSLQNTSVRKGVHKDKLVKKLYKVVYLYSIEMRRPIAYALLPGNIPDCSTVSDALKQIEVISDRKIELVDDAGYCNEETIAILLKEEQDFLTRIEADTKWIAELIDAHREELEHGGELIDCDPKFSGIKTHVERTFQAKKKKNQEPFEINGKLNVFLYFSSVNKAKDDTEFRTKFKSYAEDLKYGKILADDRKTIEAFAAKYMNIIRDEKGEIEKITVKREPYDRIMKYNGYLVLIANKEDDLNTALMKFRKREYIEEDIKNHKAHTGGNRARVWDSDTLKGQLLVQFEALTMHETLETKVNYMKTTLAMPNGDIEHDQKANIKKERKLKNWIERTSLHNILQWYDAVEYTRATNNDKAVEWVTQMTERDRMFIDKLGMNSEQFAIPDQYTSVEE